MRSDRLCGGVDESPCGGRLDETASEGKMRGAALKLGQFMSIQGMRRATTRLDSATHSLCLACSWRCSVRAARWLQAEAAAVSYLVAAVRIISCFRIHGAHIREDAGVRERERESLQPGVVVFFPRLIRVWRGGLGRSRRPRRGGGRIRKSESASRRRACRASVVAFGYMARTSERTLESERERERVSSPASWFFSHLRLPLWHVVGAVLYALQDGFKLRRQLFRI
jgi:hypothetical protein